MYYFNYYIYLLKKENNYDWLYDIIVKQECQNPSSKNYVHTLLENQQRYVPLQIL